MSSSGIHSINSGPLIIRTYNESVNTLSTNNTYLLGQYETPIPSNYILITTLNGQLAPTNNPSVSSMNVSTLTFTNGYFSTLIGSSIFNSSIQTSSIAASTLQLSSFANFLGQVSSYTLSDSINFNPINWWGKYIFISPNTTNPLIEFVATYDNGAMDGKFMVLKNVSHSNPFRVTTIDGLEYPIGARSSINIMFFDGTLKCIGI